MEKITLKHNPYQHITMLPNEFIDRYMIRADGEYVKIYLLIQRLTAQNIPIRIDQLADTLELTHKDIIRALSYWEKEGLLAVDDLIEKPPKQPSAIGGAAESVQAPGETRVPSLPQIPEKGSRNATDMEKTIRGTDLEQTVYMAETYFGRPLSASELNSFCYISDDLGFSSELLEYLIEYCITKGKKSVRYIESIAVDWYQKGVDTIQKAKNQTLLYAKNVFPVMKAFGIAGRNPGPSEIDYIRQWNSLGFETDIIVEACNRTLLATHQASFPYANRILQDWKKSGVQNASDIQSLDRKFHTSAQTSGSAADTNVQKKIPSNAFHNFEQRSYDYDDLEARLLEKHRR